MGEGATGAIVDSPRVIGNPAEARMMDDSQSRDPERTGIPEWIGVAIAAVIVAVFYFLVPGFGPAQLQSPLVWLESTWNSETDYEHGYLVPFIMIGLIAWQWKRLKAVAGTGSLAGLFIVLLGAGFFVISHRTGQARIAVGALPIILWGSAWFLWGWQVAKLTFFPLFLLALAVPVPQFQQATTKLQILSTEIAQWGCGIFGVETEIRGTQIFSTTNAWEPLEIDEGCGGIRSLMALIMISSVWAYLAKMPLWKKGVLLLSAIPLAILGNGLRLTSIFVIAEYGNPQFASGTWHDWSGLLLFYPISLFLLLLLHSLLEGGIPKLKQFRTSKRQVVTRKVEAG